MKNRLSPFWILSLLILFTITQGWSAAPAVVPDNNIQRVLSTLSPTMIPNSPEKVFTVLMRMRLKTQRIIRDHIYIKNQVVLSRATADFHAIEEEMKRDRLFIASAFEDPSLSSLIHIINANLDRLYSLMDKPYTPQNLAVIFYTGYMVSDSLLQIARAIDRDHQDPGIYRLDDLRMRLIEIAEAYLFVHEKNKVLSRFIPKLEISQEEFRKQFSHLDTEFSLPETAKQSLTEARHLWQVIDGLLEGSRVGDLPSIIFRTTTKLDQEMIRCFAQLP
jgi:hypothetical protein